MGETCDKVYVYDKQDIKSPSHFRGGVGEGLDSVSVSVFHDPWRGGFTTKPWLTAFALVFPFPCFSCKQVCEKRVKEKTPGPGPWGFVVAGIGLFT